MTEDLAENPVVVEVSLKCILNFLCSWISSSKSAALAMMGHFSSIPGSMSQDRTGHPHQHYFSRVGLSSLWRATVITEQWLQVLWYGLRKSLFRSFWSHIGAIGRFPYLELTFAAHLSVLGNGSWSNPKAIWGQITDPGSFLCLFKILTEQLNFSLGVCVFLLRDINQLLF